MAETVTRLRESDVKARIAILESQMNTVNDSVQRLDGRMENQYTALHSRISDMRDDLRTEIDKKNDQMIAMLKEHMDAEFEHHESIREKISSIEKWRWMIMGGALVVGYVLAHLKLEKLF